MALEQLPSDCLVICTRNRTEDLSNCLNSIQLSNYLPKRILIVDSSDDTSTEELTSQFGSIQAEYIKSEKGLTLQRNVGLSFVAEEIVHFLDDDVEVEPDYFLEILRAFKAAPELIGAGGMVLGGTNPKATLLGRLTGRESSIPGKVLKSGYNIGAHEYPNITKMEWLPGCSMSFSMSKIQGLKFDEKRTGYAMGEDVDFGLQASSRGVIWHIPTARLIHHLSPTNRDKITEMIRQSTINRWQLAYDHRGKVSKSAVIVTSFIEAISYLAKGLIDRDKVYFGYSKACLNGLNSAMWQKNE